MSTPSRLPNPLSNSASPSPALQNILQTIGRIAASDLGVLITGEEGTEQDWLAVMIHKMSSRARKKLVRIDCYSREQSTLEKEIFGYEDLTLNGTKMFPGAIEDAAGGTLFFDRIGDLPHAIHARLSRAITHQHFRRVGGLREFPMNVRIIAGLSRDITAAGNGDDVHHRICPVIINLPPLRERRQDIPVLINRFLRENPEIESRIPKGMKAEALDLCLAYDWPGNARELHRAIEHAVAMCPGQMIDAEHLPPYLRHPSPEHNAHQVMEHTITAPMIR